LTERFENGRIWAESKHIFYLKKRFAQVRKAFREFYSRKWVLCPVATGRRGNRKKLIRVFGVLSEKGTFTNENIETSFSDHADAFYIDRFWMFKKSYTTPRR
jgi:hypothetical protein